MILITSMGGCGSTNLIDWVSRHTDCNCPMNSEGLPSPGPGSNHKGLKHRIRPPRTDDPYLPSGKRITKSLFLFDSPYVIIPSLFRRKIAVGHAIAVTGIRPEHGNDLDKFLEFGRDTFGFSEQVENWCKVAGGPEYPRMLMRGSTIWSHLPELFDFLEIPSDLMVSFPTEKQRLSSFQRLSELQQERLTKIYDDLDRNISLFSHVQVI